MDIEELAQLLHTMDNEPTSIQTFQQAASLLKSGEIKLETEQQLIFYGLFKQVTVGDAPDMPSDSEKADVASMYKYQAWKSFAGFPRDGSMKLYVYLVNDLAASSTSDAKNSANGFGMGVSTLSGGAAGNSSTPWGEAEHVFSLIEQYHNAQQPPFNSTEDAKADCEVQAVRLLGEIENVLREVDAGSRGSIISAIRSEQGLTPLHYAADRGLCDVCALLLRCGCDVNARDADGNTALHYAVLCDHLVSTRYSR
ncbi:hypothetical protein EON64_02560 [archaeon]|nr:MAG: hypothetical protein EON64_02560 [archaeon]